MLEFMHTFEMVQNMMNHMDEYQAMFKMFEGLGGSGEPAQESGHSAGSAASPFGSFGFAMPDISAMQNIMKGSDLVDEFTYVEEPSGAGRDGS